MDWKDLAGTLIAAGAPTVGKILGGLIPIPGGSLIGEWAGNTVAEALGVPPTPEAVAKAINADPAAAAFALAPVETEAQTKIKAEAAVAIARTEVDKAAVIAVNETIRAENAAVASRPDGWWGNWRTLLAWTLAAETCAWPPFIMYCIAFNPVAASGLMSSSGLIMTWWAARFGVVGVHVWTGSNERQAVMTGTAQPGIAERVINAVRRK